MRPRTLLLSGLLALASCRGEPSHHASSPGATAPHQHLTSRQHGKPTAPVDLHLDARPDGAGYRVTLTATPTVAVDSLALTVDGREQLVGATAAGQARTLTVHVDLGSAAGREVVGSAAVDVGHQRRRAAAVLELGSVARPPAPKIHVVRLPDGSEAAEVRQ